MRARRLVWILALGFTFATAPALAASIEDWTHDIDAIVSDIEKIHPNPFTKANHATFEQEAGALKASLAGLTEAQRMVRAMRLVATIGDGHTQLEPDNPFFAYWYPIRIYEFSDGVFITSAFKSEADLAGAEILSIAGRPVSETLIPVRALMGSDNFTCVRENLFGFHNAALMKGLGLAEADGSLRLKLKLRNGKVIDRVLAAHHTDDKRYAPDDAKMDWRFVSEVYGPPLGTLDDWTTTYGGLKAIDFRTNDPKRPPHLMYRRPYSAHSLPDAHAYYIQVNNIADMKEESFNDFFRRALREVDAAKPDRLIVDIRYNPGGDGSKVPAMIHEFIKREDNPPWKHLYLLTGRKTFSAGVMMLQAFVEHTTVSLIGEPAGAGPDSYGDATTIDLTRIGAELHVSTLYHKLDDAGERPDITPVDVPASFSFADYVAGRDPAVDAILRGDEMRILSLIASEDGAAKARKAYEARAKRYRNSPDWATPRRIDLIRTIWRLDDAGKAKEAADFAALITELYPNSARAWSVRGSVEIDAGRKSEGLKSYRRALEIDPDNLDNLEQRRALTEAKLPVPQ